MCGIYGIILNTVAVNSEILKKQSDILSHRGPDDSGIWLSKSKHVGFAHRRLSIIDLSPAGHQPMVSDDGRYVIVYNGEVYNFQLLRKELEISGHHFRSNSDTEVILKSYQAWGEDCVNRFNGMFAFAIHDKGDKNTKPTIFFARDRVGKKPLYYLHEKNHFQFASELKAIDASKRIDLNALNYYLALGYVPGDLCLAKGIKKLPPAYAARLDLQTFHLKVWRYWDLPKNTLNENIDGEELADQAGLLLKDAVKLRLISDVPLGVLLSGGFDSSLIVAVAAQQSSRPVKTFHIAMPGSRFDESNYAKSVADYFSTEHYVLDANDPSLRVIDEMSPFIDEPIADSSIIPTFMVSKLTRQHVTVALGGDGGDELFGGYSHYTNSLADEQRLGWIPGTILRFLGRMVAALSAGVKGRNRIASLIHGPLQQMVWGTPYFDIALRRRLLNNDTISELGSDFDAPERWRLSLFMTGSDAVDCMTRTDFLSTLTDDFLVKIDRTSMANSLEIRSPFLDYRLVEFAFSSIPTKWKVSGNETRRIQKILAKRLLPQEFETNRKQGFSIPLDAWLRESDCALIRQYIDYLPEYIRKNQIDNLIKGEMKGRSNGVRLFALLMLGITIKNNGWS